MDGPGTVLHNALSKIGITFTKTCNCQKHVETMNEWGPAKCKEKVNEIVSWLKAESRQRSLPFSATAAKYLVLWCIHQSEKNSKND